MSRGKRREPSFLDDADRRLFLSTLATSDEERAQGVLRSRFMASPCPRFPVPASKFTSRFSALRWRGRLA
jgi:hypothetical protein